MSNFFARRLLNNHIILLSSLLLSLSVICFYYICYTACEVVCGSKIDRVFLYYTDNLVSSGANFMCQVILSVIEDLTKLLQSMDQNLPLKAIFQFDNSGENKNKEVNALMSTLIEKFFLTKFIATFLSLVILTAQLINILVFAQKRLKHNGGLVHHCLSKIYY